MEMTKCPRCGAPMQPDQHRRMEVMMCYMCGYVDDGSIAKKNDRDVEVEGKTNYEHLKTLSPNETTAFLAKAFNIDMEALSDWLDDTFKG